jgi:hypothetical protein
MLAKRLARHGVVVSGGLLVTVVAQNAASAAVPASVLNATIKATGLFAAAPAAAAGAISAKVSALTDGVLKGMFLTKAKVATAVLLVVGILGSGAGWLAHQALAVKPADKSMVVKDSPDREGGEVSGVVKSVDDSRKAIRVRLRKEAPGETTFHLVRDAKVLLDDGTGDRVAFQEGKLAEVAEGDSVTLRLTADQKVVRVWVEGPTVQGKLKAVDKANHTITATVILTKGAVADKTFAVVDKSKLSFDDGLVPDNTQPMKQVGLGDLPLKSLVTLRLSADRKAVGNVRVEGPSIAGLLKAVDRDQNTITVAIPGKDGPDMDRTFVVVKTAPVTITDGRPADRAKPAEWLNAALPLGAHVTLRLSPDEQCVVAVAAEGPTVFGVVEGVDAADGTLTLDHKVQGEKTYRVVKDAIVFFDGKDEIGKLADLSVGAVAVLKLLTDEKTVREIWVK